MQREGSALHGLGVVFIKEVSDHLTSVRMRVLEWLIVLVGIVTVFFTIQEIKESTAEDPFLFLKLFSATQEQRLSFAVFMTFLVPLVAIGLGFDSVNSEFNRRTLSRILAQPIYRDALLFGKFLAGLATLSICLVTLWLLVIGFGLIRLGIPPNGEELGRLLIFLLVTIAYAGVWLALAMLLSIVVRSTATAALIALGLWLFLALLWPALAQMIGEVISPSDIRFAQLGLPTPDTLMWQQGLSRLSPGTLYGEALVALLNPDAQSMTTLLAQFQGRIASPLPLNESIQQAWPQMVSLIAGTILLYVIGYVAFQRQEVRA
jgi:ABC-2 type transport system permease protein